MIDDVSTWPAQCTCPTDSLDHSLRPDDENHSHAQTKRKQTLVTKTGPVQYVNRERAAPQERSTIMNIAPTTPMSTTPKMRIGMIATAMTSIAGI